MRDEKYAFSMHCRVLDILFVSWNDVFYEVNYTGIGATHGLKVRCSTD